MKRASDHHSIMAMETFVINDVCMIGLINTLNMDSITSAEYMSLKEQTQAARGIRIINGLVVAIINTTSSMIYLANADQLQNNNTMMKVSLVHDEWSTR